MEATALGKDLKYRQPFLLSVGMEKNPSQFFIIAADSTAIPAGTSTVGAFDMLFKCHFAFKVEYAAPLMGFYSFIAGYIYNALPQSQVKASIRSMAANILNMKEPEK